MKIIDDIYIGRQVKKTCKKFIKNHLDSNGCSIELVMLAGSHTKNTNNKDSDIDLRIYYRIPIKDFLKVDKVSPRIIDCDMTIDPQSKSKTYSYKNNKIEVNFIPLKKNTGKKELMYNLIKPNVDYYFKFVRGVPIIQTETMERFRDWMLREYVLCADSAFGYFNGYMVSQLQRHRRRKDGQRRAMQARQLNSVTPVVKLTIDGLYIGLSGIEILRNQTISRNMKALYKRNMHLFNSEIREFIEFCIDHKLRRTPANRPVWHWIEYAMKNRDDMFKILVAEMKKSLDETSLPNPIDKYSKNVINKAGIESWLINEFYKVELK
jgi:hypothetical protein